MDDIKLNEFYIFEISIKVKASSLNVSIAIKILFFRVSVTIGLSLSLLTVCYHELFNTGFLNELVDAQFS